MRMMCTKYHVQIAAFVWQICLFEFSLSFDRPVSWMPSPPLSHSHFQPLWRRRRRRRRGQRIKNKSNEKCHAAVCRRHSSSFLTSLSNYFRIWLNAKYWCRSGDTKEKEIHKKKCSGNQRSGKEHERKCAAKNQMILQFSRVDWDKSLSRSISLIHFLLSNAVQQMTGK